jgi:excinuclease UvrABC ATPase subunit
VSKPKINTHRESVRLTDQAALFGLLARLRDLGAAVLLVEHLPDG